MRVFITGLTGSLGAALARLHHARGDTVFGCARSEAGAVRWHSSCAHLGTLLVCDAQALSQRNTDAGRFLPTMDRLYHCAASKHVELCEQDPVGAVWQNVMRTHDVAVACGRVRVPLVFVSTDKACLPQSIYGATKLIAERAVTRMGGAAVRLGNLAGSQGSVFAKWREAAARGDSLTLTDPRMTRYFMRMEDAAAFLADRCVPGRVAIPHPLRAACMGDLAEATGCRISIADPRPGESQHQWLVAPGDAIEEDGNRITLGNGQVVKGGLCSSHAMRWDARELLEVGGFFG